MERHETRASWLEARRKAVGASEVAAIIAPELCSYLTPFQVYQSKVVGQEVEDNPQMKMGRLIEGAIVELYVDETGRRVRNPGEHTIYRHESAPLAATPDRILVTPYEGPLQIKSVGMSMSREWRGDEPPPLYQIQVQAEMACTGHRKACLAGWVGGQELIWWDINYNAEFVEAMLETVSDWWKRHVESGIAPEVTERDTKAISRLWPKDDGRTVALDDRVRKLTDSWLTARALRLDAERREDHLANQLKVALKDATFGLLPDGRRLKWAVEHRKEHLVAASSFRRLRVLKAKKG